MFFLMKEISNRKFACDKIQSVLSDFQICTDNCFIGIPEKYAITSNLISATFPFGGSLELLGNISKIENLFILAEKNAK